MVQIDILQHLESRHIADVTLTTAAQTSSYKCWNSYKINVDGDITAGNANGSSSSSVDGSARYSNGTFYLSRGGVFRILLLVVKHGTSGNTVEINLSDGFCKFAGDIAIADTIVHDGDNGGQD